MVCPSLIRRLQSVQNATAQLIFGLQRSEHITRALISLHWLHIPERISFKLAVLTHRATDGAGPSYFQSCFTRVVDMPSRRRLRSSGSDCLHVPIIRRSTVAHSQLTAPRYGTTCRLTSQLRRHSRSSDSALRHFCSRDHTLTLSLNL